MEASGQASADIHTECTEVSDSVVFVICVSFDPSLMAIH